MVKDKNISNVIPEEDIKIYCDFAQGMTPLNLSKKYHKKKSDINDRIRKVKQNYTSEELELFVLVLPLLEEEPAPDWDELVFTGGT